MFNIQMLGSQTLDLLLKGGCPNTAALTLELTQPKRDALKGLIDGCLFVFAFCSQLSKEGP